MESNPTLTYCVLGFTCKQVVKVYELLKLKSNIVHLVFTNYECQHTIIMSIVN